MDYWFDQNDMNKMGGTCSTYGGEVEVYTVFLWGNLRERKPEERDHLENPDVDGRIILTHCGRVTQICVYVLQVWKTDDAHLRF